MVDVNPGRAYGLTSRFIFRMSPLFDSKVLKDYFYIDFKRNYQISDNTSNATDLLLEN